MYALYLDPVECKLSMLRGTRDYAGFRSSVLPLITNLWTPLSPEQEKVVIEVFFAHILEVHQKYLEQLKKRMGKEGLLKAAGYPDAENEKATVSLIRRCNGVLRDIDGSKLVDDYDMLRKQAGKPVVIPEELPEAFEEAKQAFADLEHFFDRYYKVCMIHHSPLKSIHQFMAYASHLARGYVKHIRGKEAEGKQDFASAVRHLKRVTLDMRKSILITVFKNTAKQIPASFCKSVLSNRDQELVDGLHTPDKLHMYKSEVVQVLSHDWL